MSALNGTAEVYETLRLRDGVSAGRGRGGVHLVGYPDVRPIGDEDLALVRALASGEHRAGEFSPRERRLLAGLRRDGWLVATVHDGDTPVYTLDPHICPDGDACRDGDARLNGDACAGGGACARGGACPGGDACADGGARSGGGACADGGDPVLGAELVDPPVGARLSRFTTIAAVPGGGLRATSPRAWAAITVHAPGALAVLADPGARVPHPGIGARAAALLRRDLLRSGLAVTGEEDTEFRVRQWSAIDLAFHRSSRGIDGAVGVAGGFGATYWGLEHLTDPSDRPPATAPGAGSAAGSTAGLAPGPAARSAAGLAAGSAMDLPLPDLERVLAADPKLTEVLRARRSVRDHDAERPITAGQLAEFLYRCAATSDHPTPYGDRPRRAYPGGGGIHELELYVVAHQVDGLEPGTYHYDGYGHRLEPLGRKAGAERVLLDAARSMSGARARPQVLLLVTARFERLMWVYEGLAYALILKNLGVLVQTMYLVATAMGLGGCALGSSAPRAFQRISGADPLREDVVGEFMLGTVAVEHQTGGDA
ncbi:SagB-type dehydrogenase family enzyme [Nonomuraea fuscirosea]|uniref:SagB-type dehydrogenase family enzyme n=1 Tax=Nonomuraea fuscirosea TaxID=1291556 RepID=A0A2T0MR32_9ACTN|nr:SagB-type dehydrogenase family enzyme [Nonomuraea fuscirosea]